ncbi:hypothetical protein [Yoonia sp.]|uniref:hypothetical protein n=1 Tax=Yoonia sp. TaxID=2212373 RepID=UPI002E04CCB8|nr:hypothetical protein [Yoonia sp.]
MSKSGKAEDSSPSIRSILEAGQWKHALFTTYVLSLSYFESEVLRPLIQTGRELLVRLQAAHPNDYPDALIRTVQRRLKIWRADMARTLVFGTNDDVQPPMTSDALRNLEAARVRGHLEPTEPDTTTGKSSREQMSEATA